MCKKARVVRRRESENIQSCQKAVGKVQSAGEKSSGLDSAGRNNSEALSPRQQSIFSIGFFHQNEKPSVARYTATWFLLKQMESEPCFQPRRVSGILQPSGGQTLEHSPGRGLPAEKSWSAGGGMAS
jgi:hypothetical protein